MDRAFAAEKIVSGTIPGQVKPNTIEIGFTAFLLDVQQLKGQCEAPAVCGRQMGKWQPDLKTERFLKLSPDQGNLVNEMQLRLQIYNPACAIDRWADGSLT